MSVPFRPPIFSSSSIYLATVPCAELICCATLFVDLIPNRRSNDISKLAVTCLSEANAVTDRLRRGPGAGRGKHPRNHCTTQRLRCCFTAGSVRNINANVNSWSVLHRPIA
jgi:hypothetical protein